MSVLFPSTIGGTIAASDSDSISTEIDVSGLPIATKVYNLDVGVYFTLTVSTASLVTDEVLAVKDITGLRWIVDAASGVESVTATTANAVDNSDDQNPIIKNASASNAGVLSASDKTGIDAVSLTEWTRARRLEVLAVVPELTEFQTVGFGTFPASTTAPTFDGGIPGCGITSGGQANILYIGRSLAQTPKTGKGSVVFRAKLGLPTGTDVNDIGLVNAAQSHVVCCRRKATATDTHWFIEAHGGGVTSTPGTIVSNSNWHDFMLSWRDGAFVKLHIDNALALSLTDLTNVLDDIYFPFIEGTDGVNTTICHAMMFAYIPA